MSEIPGFLSDEECDHLISKAEDEGMRSSIARGGLTKLDKWEFHSTSKLKSSLKEARIKKARIIFYTSTDNGFSLVLYNISRLCVCLMFFY